MTVWIDTVVAILYVGLVTDLLWCVRLSPSDTDIILKDKACYSVLVMGIYTVCNRIPYRQSEYYCIPLHCNHKASQYHKDTVGIPQDMRMSLERLKGYHILESITLQPTYKKEYTTFTFKMQALF